jgi:hypothetical protein
MSYPPIETIQQEVQDWDLIRDLPDKMGAFTKKITNYIEGQVLYICRYESEPLRASIDITYTAETFDYILVRTMGMNSYRDIRLIYKERDVFAEKARHYIPEILKSMEDPASVNLGEMVEAKGLKDWEYGKNLPKKIGPFELYISPDKAIEHINGSIIMIDYTDFTRKDQLIIMYNRLRNEFFGEMKINSVFHASMDFDSKTLQELEKRLDEHLESTLKQITEADHEI